MSLLCVFNYSSKSFWFCANFPLTQGRKLDGYAASPRKESRFDTLVGVPLSLSGRVAVDVAVLERKQLLAAGAG